MFSSKQSADPSPREELMVDIARHPANYFHSSALTEMSSEDLSTLMCSDSLHYTNALITLNNGYNGADQVIGENVQFLLVELTASQD